MFAFSNSPGPASWAERVAPFLADGALSSVLVLLLAWAVARILKTSSAAVRHFVWCQAVAGLALLPIFSLVLPSWRVLPNWRASSTAHVADKANATVAVDDLLPSTVPSKQSTSGTHKTPVRPIATTPAPAAAASGWASSAMERDVATQFSAPLPPPTTDASPGDLMHVSAAVVIVGLWLFGCLAALAPCAVGAIGLWRLSRTCRPVADTDRRAFLAQLVAERPMKRRVELLTSSQPFMPMTWGVWRPRIALPASAANWSAERLRVVLVHELAHIRRWDCLTQFVARLVCAAYWFNPLAWYALRQLQLERERACDDWVLHSGCRASDYAEHLLGVVSAFHDRIAARQAAVAMAQSSKLEERMKTILDPQCRRNGMTRRGILVACVSMVLLIVPLAMVGGESVPASEGKAPKKAAADAPVAVALPDGLQVELLGLTNHPARERWWKADGTPLNDAPYEDLDGDAVVPGTDQIGREIAFAVRVPSGSALRWDTEPSTTRAGPGIPMRAGERLPHVRAMAVVVEPSQKTLAVRLGYSAGEWDTVAFARGSAAMSRNEKSVVFAEPVEKDGRIVMSVAHNIADEEVRVVAVDRNGKVHSASRSNSGRAGTVRQTTYTFADVALDDVRQFQLETRPYRWIEFQNVSLHPGRKTDVRVMVEQPHAGRPGSPAAANARRGAADEPPMEAATGRDASEKQPPAAAEEEEDGGQAKIDEALRRGRAFLRERQNADGSWKFPGGEKTYLCGTTALAVQALLTAPGAKDDEAVRKALAFLRQSEPSMTYEVALQTIVLCAVNAPEDRKLIERNVEELSRRQINRGNHIGLWSYNGAENRDFGGDGSNAHYALAALRAARQAGYRVDAAVWKRAWQAWVENQNADGSWSYQVQGHGKGTGSMTAVGIAAVSWTRPVAAKTAEERQRSRQAIDRALAWLAKHFAVARNPQSMSWTLYYLHALAEAGAAESVTMIGNHNWRKEATAMLLATQNRDGSWRGIGPESAPTIATSFALATLTMPNPAGEK